MRDLIDPRTGPASAPAARLRGPVGLVIALPEELRPICAALGLVGVDRNLRRGVVGRFEVVALLGGLGADQATAATEKLIAVHRCTGLISLGYGGGLDPALAVGDVVAVGAAVEADGTVWPANPFWIDRMHHEVQALGACLSLPRPVATPAEKAAWRARSRAAVVDLETAAVAAVAKARRVPWVGLRAISDAAGDSIPAVVHERIRPDLGRVETGLLVRRVLPRPGHWPELIVLANRSRHAAGRLARCVTSFLEKLI